MDLRLERVVWLMVALVVAASGSLPAGAADDQADLKARFFYRLASYVTWPEASFSSPSAPIVLAVVGDSGFASRLRDVSAGQQTGGRSFEVQAVETGAPLPAAHMVYIAGTDAEALSEGARAFDAQPALRVAEGERFTRVGDIGIELVKGRVMFFANQRSLRREGLKVSSKLLNLASTAH